MNEEINEVVTSKITNIAEQEVNTNKEFFKNGEAVAGKLVKGFPMLLLKLQNIMKKAKAKQIVSAVIAAVDLPKDGLPVRWIDAATKRPKPEHEVTVEIFRLTQELITARLFIAQQDWLKVIKPMLEQDLKEKMEQIQLSNKGDANE